MTEEQELTLLEKQVAELERKLSDITRCRSVGVEVYNDRLARYGGGYSYKDGWRRAQTVIGYPAPIS